MPGEVALSTTTVIGFLLVLTRILSAFIFVPFPGMRQIADVPKIVAAAAVAIALYPVWPGISPQITGGQLFAYMVSEAAFGLTVGLAVGFLLESFVYAAQMLGLQAGYSYASTIDPATQSDATVLQALLQLLAGLLFFAAGLDRDVLRIFAESLRRWPPGEYRITEGIATAVWQLGASAISTGLRLALPVIALMLLVDFSLALLGRINAQLQLLSLAFPLKMLASMAMLAALLGTMAVVFNKAAQQTLAVVGRIGN